MSQCVPHGATTSDPHLMPAWLPGCLTTWLSGCLGAGVKALLTGIRCSVWYLFLIFRETFFVTVVSFVDFAHNRVFLFRCKGVLLESHSFLDGYFVIKLSILEVVST